MIVVIVDMAIVIFLVLVAVVAVAVFLDLLSVLLPASITSFFSFLPSSLSASPYMLCPAQNRP